MCIISTSKSCDFFFLHLFFKATIPKGLQSKLCKTYCFLFTGFGLFWLKFWGLAQPYVMRWDSDSEIQRTIMLFMYGFYHKQ